MFVAKLFSIPQEGILDHPTRWFDSNLQHLFLLFFSHVDHVYCAHCLCGHWWHPDSQEGVYNSLAPLGHAENHSSFLCTMYVSDLGSKGGTYKNKGKVVCEGFLLMGVGRRGGGRRGGGGGEGEEGRRGGEEGRRGGEEGRGGGEGRRGERRRGKEGRRGGEGGGDEGRGGGYHTTSDLKEQLHSFLLYLQSASEKSCKHSSWNQLVTSTTMYLIRSMSLPF